MQISVSNVLAVAVVVLSVAAVISMSGSGQLGICQPKPGYIFSDCIDPGWYGISSWEISYDDNIENMTMDPSADDLVQWKLEQSGDDEHGVVLDVQFSNHRANGRLRFHAAGAGNFVDMSEYRSGLLEFDVRIIEWGIAEKKLVVRVMCGFPCGSDTLVVPLADTHEWQRVQMPIQAFIDSGLDITRVDIGLALSPTWNRMQGMHFQLDNIRWLKAGGVLPAP